MEHYTISINITIVFICHYWTVVALKPLTQFHQSELPKDNQPLHYNPILVLKIFA